MKSLVISRMLNDTPCLVSLKSFLAISFACRPCEWIHQIDGAANE